MGGDCSVRSKGGWVVFGERAWCVSVDMGSCSLDSAHETPVGPPPTLLHTEGNPASLLVQSSVWHVFRNIQGGSQEAKTLSILTTNISVLIFPWYRRWCLTNLQTTLNLLQNVLVKTNLFWFFMEIQNAIIEEFFHVFQSRNWLWI